MRVTSDRLRRTRLESSLRQSIAIDATTTTLTILLRRLPRGMSFEARRGESPIQQLMHQRTCISMPVILIVEVVRMLHAPTGRFQAVVPDGG